MISLASKYRPHTLQEVVGQEIIVKILGKQLDNGDVSNCYILSGPSGCGKTTLARIFANDLNKGVGVPIEIDAASNNGVDNVRNIIANASERALDGEYKVIIIDECHMLTTQAWNAFLKCIEEPPKYTIFMFCTTEVYKIPDTIKNRCMIFTLNKINQHEIEDRLKFICKEENFINYEDTCKYISTSCNNQMRDAIALLERCSILNSQDLNLNSSLEILGVPQYEILFDLINAIIDGNDNIVVEKIEYVYNNGYDLKQFINLFISFILDVTKYILFKNTNLLKMPESFFGNLDSIINFDNSKSYYNYIMNKLLELKNMLKADTNYFETIEMVLLQMARCQ